MIINLLVNTFVEVVGAIFQFFPAIDTLPTIGGYDIDTALVGGMGVLRTFMVSFWPLQDMFLGFLALLAYFGIKVLGRFLLGHRFPARH